MTPFTVPFLGEKGNRTVKEKKTCFGEHVSDILEFWTGWTFCFDNHLSFSIFLSHLPGDTPSLLDPPQPMFLFLYVLLFSFSFCCLNFLYLCLKSPARPGCWWWRLVVTLVTSMRACVKGASDHVFLFWNSSNVKVKPQKRTSPKMNHFSQTKIHFLLYFL